MDIEIEPGSSSPLLQTMKSVPHERAKHARKKKLVLLFIVTGLSVFGALAYLNKSPAPTTWQSMRTDYKNTK